MERKVLHKNNHELQFALIGNGNLGAAWQSFFKTQNIKLLYHIKSRYESSEKINKHFQLHNLLVIICVSDSSIELVAQKYTGSNNVLVHCSGTTTLSLLNNYVKYAMVLYPLQTFKKGLKADITKCQIFFECSHKSLHKTVLPFFKNRFTNCKSLNSDERLKLHLAAVFTNNFVNHILGISHELLNDIKQNKSVLLPLLQTTIERSLTSDAFQIQTGPAIRNDIKTIKKHLSILAPNKYYTKVYKALTESIQQER
jgi:predicted short-subunit dehydrogenase-like oxidoreductase (DUF2520 family)